MKYRVVFPLVRKVMYEQGAEDAEQVKQEIELGLWQLNERLGFQSSHGPLRREQYAKRLRAA